MSHGQEGEDRAGLVDRGQRVTSDSVNVDNSMLVSVGWDINSLIGGREDVTMEEKLEGDRERRFGLKVTRGGEVGGVGGRQIENWIK